MDNERDALERQPVADGVSNSELIKALGGYLPGDIVRQYHHSDMYDDAEIVHVHGNGALDVRSLKTGDMWGWSERTCTVISRPTNVITGWRDERTDRMNTDTTEKQTVADCVSQSALIRRCTALLLILTGLALGHLGWELTHDRNWMEAVEKIYYAAITLLTTLMLPYK